MEARAEWVTVLPAAPLQAFVDRYVGYRLSGFPPGLHRGLASRHMTFIVSIGPPIEVVSQADARQSPASYRCVVSGLQASSALISHDGDQEGIAIELSPLGCRSLSHSSRPAGPATSAHSTDVFARRFRDEFGLGPKRAGRIIRFERARRMLRAAPSFVTLAQVAAACGYYDQAHLNRDFTQLAGCPPTTWMAEDSIFPRRRHRRRVMVGP